MSENVESDFHSISSSQISLLKISPFADPNPIHESQDIMSETDSTKTEILLHTPVLSFSSPNSPYSVNDDDVFRTPPENNASLSSTSRHVSVSPPSLPATEVLSDSLTPLCSPPSVRTVDVSVPGMQLDYGSSSENKIFGMENSGGDLRFRDIIEALVRNSGKNFSVSGRDEKVNCVDLLKQCGLKFP